MSLRNETTPDAAAVRERIASIPDTLSDDLTARMIEDRARGWINP